MIVAVTVVVVGVIIGQYNVRWVDNGIVTIT